MSLPGIPKGHVESVCRLGQGEACCAFLVAGGNGFECSKGSSLEPILRARLEAGTMNAKGDNCPGWLITVAQN